MTHSSTRRSRQEVATTDTELKLMAAAAQLSILRAIASSDLHNLVYRADYRIVPVATASPATLLAHGVKAM